LGIAGKALNRNILMFSKLLMSKVADGEEELNVTVSDVFGPEAYAHLKGEVLEEQWKRTNLTAPR